MGVTDCRQSPYTPLPDFLTVPHSRPLTSIKDKSDQRRGSILWPRTSTKLTYLTKIKTLTIIPPKANQLRDAKLSKTLITEPVYQKLAAPSLAHSVDPLQTQSLVNWVKAPQSNQKALFSTLPCMQQALSRVKAADNTAEPLLPSSLQSPHLKRKCGQVQDITGGLVMLQRAGVGWAKHSKHNVSSATGWA